MSEYVKRERYLQRLIDRRDNGDVKIITGPRRSGKSFLLKTIYRDYLVSQGVLPENIIIVSLDEDDENNQSELADKELLKAYIYERILSNESNYYVFLDEIQEIDGFEKVVNGLNAKENIDVYITGSNSHLLSSDINTIFRGRGDEVHVEPFCFKEFCEGRTEPKNELWKEFYTYGGLPALRKRKTPQQKIAYLQRLWEKTYIADVVERHRIKNTVALDALVDQLCSSIGSFSNPNNISNTLLSVQHCKVDAETVSTYIGYLEDAYLFRGSRRYNIKGKRYYESLKKYYCTDIGLRNARLNFRQQEITHIMENVIYNELCSRGYLVDVGMIESRELVGGKQEYRQYEVDFIVADGMRKYYIQSAYAIPDEDKMNQELKSFRKIDDSFQKIVIVRGDIATYTNDDGIVFMGLMQFLENETIL